MIVRAFVTRSAVCALGVLSLLMSSDEAIGGILVFSDRASFRANTTGNALEDFNSVLQDTNFAFTDLIVNDITLSSDGGASPFGEQALIDLPSYVAFANGVDGTAMVNSRGLDFGQSITITLPGIFSAIGFDFDNYDSQLEGLSVVLNGDTVASIPSTGTPGFLGIVDTMGSFSQFQLLSTSNESPASGGTFNGIDNLEWGNSTVPEPTSMAVWGMGILGLGALRRRRRKR